MPLTGSGIRNILFAPRLHNPTQLPAQLTFRPAQFASKKSAQFSFFFRTLSEGLHSFNLSFIAKFFIANIWWSFILLDKLSCLNNSSAIKSFLHRINEQ